MILAQVNEAHPSISFTCVKERNGCLSFLDTFLEKRDDDTIRRSIYRKKTWSGQYTHFHSFVPLSYKKNLITTLVDRANKICSEDTLPGELEIIRNTLHENAYPDRFVKRHMKTDKDKPSFTTAPKKPLYLQLPFRGDIIAELLKYRLRKAINGTFPAARLNLTFTTQGILRSNSKDKLSSLTTSMCIYKFNCSCGASYLGRTTRQLSKRIREHLPVWFSKGLVKQTNSSILNHLLDTGHQINHTTSFTVIHRIPNKLSHGVRFRLLCTAEAVAIRLFNPELCVQKKHVQSLSLPWPKS